MKPKHSQAKRPATRLLPHEVLDKVQAASTVEERVAVLQRYESFALKSILQANFSPKVVFDLPKGDAPYTKDTNPPDKSVSRIDTSIKVLKHLLVSSTMPRVRKEVKFIQFLESINTKDADVIIAMKDKHLSSKYPNLTLQVVKTAFPTLLK